MRDRRERLQAMVDQQIAARGVHDVALLKAMREVPREAFVDARMAKFAYDDAPLPIGAGQTISQPYVVAVMLEAARIEASDTVLEVGAGSGYVAALMSRMARRVYAIERHAELADAARERLLRLGYANIEIRAGDGTEGWPEAGPFEAVIVSAGGPSIPLPLCRQIALGGRLVMPIGEAGEQRLVCAVRTGEDDFDEEDLGSVRFVPLIGTHGWPDAAEQRQGHRH